MNLTYYPFEPMQIDNDEVTIISTSNSICYSNLINGLTDFESVISISNADYQNVEIKSAICWFGDIVTKADLNHLFQSQLQKKLAVDLDEKERITLNELDKQIKAKVFEAAFRYDLPLVVDNSCDYQHLIKYCNIGFLVDKSHNPYGIMEAVIKVAAELAEQRIIVLTDINHYLNVNQINELIKLINTLGLYVLLVCFSETNQGASFKECRYYYIDNDFVLWPTH